MSGVPSARAQNSTIVGCTHNRLSAPEPGNGNSFRHACCSGRNPGPVGGHTNPPSPRVGGTPRQWRTVPAGSAWYSSALGKMSARSASAASISSVPIRPSSRAHPFSRHWATSASPANRPPIGLGPYLPIHRTMPKLAAALVLVGTVLAGAGAPSSPTAAAAPTATGPASAASAASAGGTAVAAATASGLVAETGIAGAARIVATPDGQGFYVLAHDGTVHCGGAAVFSASVCGVHLKGPVLEAAATTDGPCWCSAHTDGGMFT